MRLAGRPAMRCVVLWPLLVAAALFLPLTACFSGDPWFGAADAVDVLEQGDYQLQEAGRGPDRQPGEVIGISRLADGRLLVDGADRPMQAIITRLYPDRDGGPYIVQLSHADGLARSPLFLLLDKAGDRLRMMIPRCGGEAATLAQQSGGSVSRDPQSAASCTFGTREAMMQALRLQAEDAADAQGEGKWEIDLMKVQG